MKKLILYLAFGYFPALVITTGAYAQTSVNPEILEPQKNVAAVSTVTISNSELAAISPKALKHFSKAYQYAANASWDVMKDGFTVKFTAGEVSNRIYYNKKGQWSGSLKGYAEDKLLKEIRNLVKREYFDFAITYVQEVETPDSHGNPTYIVHMEDSKTLKQVRICEGQMDNWREYKKQNNIALTANH